MSHLIIQGRRTVSGTHRVSGNKNAALPMIAASLLTAEPVTLANVPDISDVRVMLEALKAFGSRVDAADLPRGVSIVFSVVPRECFGASGKPLRSAPLELPC